MKIKILLFLVSCIVNTYCMNKQSSTNKVAHEIADILANMSNEENNQIPIRHLIPIENRRKLSRYCIKCPNCNTEFIRQGKATLIRALFKHLYSKRHRPEIYEECSKYIKQKAYYQNGVWYIKCSGQNKTLRGCNRSRLLLSFINHKYNTRENNPIEFQKIEKYVKDNMETISP